MNTPVALVVAGAVDEPTGGSIYNRSMAERLPAEGWRVDVHELDASFPFPHDAALRHAAQVLAKIPRRTLALVDGLAFGAMPEVVEQASLHLRLVAVVHLPLAAEVGLDAACALHLQRSEQRALAAASMVVVTGESTLPLMAQHGLSHPCTVVVEPGTDPSPLASGSGTGQVHVLSVATVNAGKGHRVLIEALSSLPAKGWRVTCAGSLTRDPAMVDDVRALISRNALDDRVRLAGAVTRAELAAWYDRSDLFVQSSLRETYGMALAEALARGLPVVSTATGAAPALLADDAGLLVPPGDAAALAHALSRAIFDAPVRERCAARSRRVRESLPTWDDAARRLSAALRSGASDG